MRMSLDEVAVSTVTCNNFVGSFNLCTVFNLYKLIQL